MGTLLDISGFPGGTHEMGNALARNPFPIVIPYHRALREDGFTCGFMSGWEMKIHLLEMEGTHICYGKVLMDRV